jgi:Rrf2 family protein
MLSQRAKYALRAMIRLAGQSEQGPVSVTALARDTKISRAFLEQIFSDLRRSNLVVSHRGKQGGFLLARPPKDISFADIIRPIDGPLALAPCASRTAYRPCDECVAVENCPLRPTLIAARDASAKVLEHTSLADCIKASGVRKPRAIKKF